MRGRFRLPERALAGVLVAATLLTVSAVLLVILGIVVATGLLAASWIWWWRRRLVSTGTRHPLVVRDTIPEAPTRGS